MRPIRCIALPDPPPPQKKKKFAPSLTADNTQSSQWNSVKIVYNSTHFQIETLNFTFAWQTVIVCFYVCLNFQELAMPNTKYSINQSIRNFLEWLE